MTSLSKEEYRRLLLPLRDRLLAAQTALRKSGHSALAVIVTGVPAAGRSESMGDLLEWLDPKFVSVHAHDPQSPCSGSRPVFWQHWLDLPAKGRIGLFFGGWYEEWLHAACREPQDDRRLARHIRALEAMLIREGVQVLKIHLHVPRDVQRKRLAKLAGNPLTRWRVTAEDQWLATHSKRVNAVYARCLKATTSRAIPWFRIEGSDAEFRSLAVGERVLWALRKAARFKAASPQKPPPVKRLPAWRVKRLPEIAEQEYEDSLLSLQGQLARLARSRHFLKRGAVLAFEGMDAAGKGGAIRRLVQALDVRQYAVVPVSAPSAEERVYPWLWRFWRPIPERGRWTIFDRSWYGRVLVERVRGFAARSDWLRAYDEIRDFELQLTRHGLVLCKFWLDVSPAEQLVRFRERKADPLKRFKVDPEDWINRRHFAAYRAAAADMVSRTSTPTAPWTLIDGDNKHAARLAVLRTVIEAIERTR